MKRIMTSAIVLGVVSLASVASLNAQTPGGRASFHIGGGLTIPMGDFKDGFKTGWQAMGGVDFGLSGLPFMLRVDGLYGQNNAKDALNTALGTTDAKTKFFGGMAGAQYVIGSGPAPVKPYILGEIGAVNTKFSAGGSSASKTHFAFAPGLGIQFGLGSLHAFVEGKYLSIHASGGSLNMIPIIVGIRFGGGM
jgi:opacity protein-like surface antigen